MIKINDTQSVNEYEVTQAMQIEDKYWIIMTSGEKLQVSKEIYDKIKGGN